MFNWLLYCGLLYCGLPVFYCIPALRRFGWGSKTLWHETTLPLNWGPGGNFRRFRSHDNLLRRPSIAGSSTCGNPCFYSCKHGKFLVGTLCLHCVVVHHVVVSVLTSCPHSP